MRRGGIITARRKQRERAKRIRAGVMTAGLVLLLCALAMSQMLKDRIASLMEGGISAVGVFAEKKTETAEVILPKIEVYALQLGVFDSGERARSEQQRLSAQGIPCVIWQRDQMRLICSVATSREALDLSAAGKNEAYVVRDTLAQVTLRLSGAQRALEEAKGMVSLPDALLHELLSNSGRPLKTIVGETRWRARKALDAHPENALYHSLAQSLLDWCDAAEAAQEQRSAACYAAVTMCTLCREWRNALLDAYSLSAESTASAQRTPSTAADVMPPA